MKKKILSLLVLLAAAVSGAWAEEVTIGDPTATTTNEYLPTHSLYEKSITQQIYTADEIGMGGTINALTMWLKNSSSYTRNLNIYMKEVDKSTFASVSDWVSMTNDDLVATATLDNGTTDPVETTFTLTTPFEYSGTGNLVICFQDVTGSWSSGAGSVVMTTSGNQAIYAYRDDTTYDVTAPGVNGTLLNVKSVVKLDIEAAGGYQLTKAEDAEAHGTIAFTNANGDEITTAQEGQTVTVTITPAEGWVVNEPSGQWIAAIAASRNRVVAQGTDIDLLNAVTLTPVANVENQWTFTMERANVEISCTYKMLLGNTNITIDEIAPLTYNGQEQTPEVVLMNGTTQLVKDVDYTLTYSNNKNACAADAAENAPTVTITAVATSELYAGEASVTFTIQKAEMSITADDMTILYGDPVPVYTVSYDTFLGDDSEADLGGTLAFDCEYQQNSEQGTYTITASGQTSDNYNLTYYPGTLTVEKAPITDDIVEVIGDYSYDSGNEVKPKVEVIFNGRELQQDIEYSLSYENNIEAGIGTVIVTGIGNNFTGEVRKQFVIQPFIVWEEDIEVSIGSVNGKPTFSVTVAGEELVMGRDYTLEFFDADGNPVTLAQVLASPGVYTVVATFMGNYTGSVSETIDINEVVTGIDAMKADGQQTYYDLQGRRVNGTPTRKGVFVLNGNKVVIK